MSSTEIFPNIQHLNHLMSDLVHLFQVPKDQMQIKNQKVHVSLPETKRDRSPEAANLGKKRQENSGSKNTPDSFHRRPKSSNIEKMPPKLQQTESPATHRQVLLRSSTLINEMHFQLQEEFDERIFPRQQTKSLLAKSLMSAEDKKSQAS